MANLRINLAGQRFGRLVVVAFAGRNERGQALWVCECDCGTKGRAASLPVQVEGTAAPEVVVALIVKWRGQQIRANRFSVGNSSKIT